MEELNMFMSGMEFLGYGVVVTALLLGGYGVWCMVRDSFLGGGNKVVGKGVKRVKSNFTYCP